MALVDCPECQNKISSKASTCPKCGSENQFIECPECNSVVINKTAICVECGYNLHKIRNDSSEHSEVNDGSGSLLNPILWIIGLVIMIWFMFFMRSCAIQAGEGLYRALS